MRFKAVIVAALLLAGCNAREVPIEGEYRYVSGNNITATLLIKKHGYSLCTPVCADGTWNYEAYQTSHTRLAFKGPIIAFTDRVDPTSQILEDGAKIGNVEFGYGCPCIYFGEPDGGFFQMKGVLIQEKVAKLWKKP